MYVCMYVCMYVYFLCVYIYIYIFVYIWGTFKGTLIQRTTQIDPISPISPRTLKTPPTPPPSSRGKILAAQTNLSAVSERLESAARAQNTELRDSEGRVMRQVGLGFGGVFDL